MPSQQAECPQSHHKRANGTHLPSALGTECASHTLPPLRTCGTSGPLQGFVCLEAQPPSPPLGRTALCRAERLTGTAQCPAGQDGCLHLPGTLLLIPTSSLRLAILSASWPKLSACSKTYLPRGLFHAPDPSNNGHRKLTTSATEDCTAGLSGPFAPRPFSWCVGHQLLNAQVTQFSLQIGLHIQSAQSCLPHLPKPARTRQLEGPAPPGSGQWHLGPSTGTTGRASWSA